MAQSVLGRCVALVDLAGYNTADVGEGKEDS